MGIGAWKDSEGLGVLGGGVIRCCNVLVQYDDHDGNDVYSAF